MTSDYLPFHPNPKKPDFAVPPGAVDAHRHVFGHAFANDARPSYVPEAAELAHQRSEAFLARVLG